jgi:hypothetical protein
MNKFFLSFCLILVVISCNNKHNSSAKNKRIKKEFLTHFKILDSAVSSNKSDTIYHCCTNSIQFMELNTGIDAYSDGTFIGKLSFSKNNWHNWHNWFNERFKK